MYVLNSTRVASVSINSAPDPAAVTAAVGRAEMDVSFDDPALANPLVERASYVADLALLNPLGGAAGDVPTEKSAHVSINFSTGEAPQALQSVQSSIENKDFAKSCQKNTVNCRNFTYIGTHNVRTIRLSYKQQELAHTFADSGLVALAIQEHRIVHSEPFKSTMLGKDAYMVTTPAWRNAAGASTGGVGFYLTKMAHEAIIETHLVSPRIMGVTLEGNPKCTILSVYSPTECAELAEAEQFHNELRGVISNIPAHNLVLVLGDFNAHLGIDGADDKRWYFHDSTNRNGKLLRDTLLECDLEVTNTRFRKNKRKMWTFLSDGTLTKAQLDLVLVRNKWKNSVKNTEAYNYLNSLGSDHRLVRTKLKLSLRKAASKPRRVIYDWDNFRNDSDLQLKFAVEVRNRYNALCEVTLGDDSREEHLDSTTDYSHFCEAVTTTCKAHIPARKKRRKCYIAGDARVRHARADLEKAKNVYHNCPDEDRRHDVKLSKNALEAAYNEAEEELLDKQIREVEKLDALQRSRQAWGLVNEISGRKKGSSAQITGTSAANRKKAWHSHFQKLLGEQPPEELDSIEIEQMYEVHQDISTAPFSVDELKEAKSRIKENKACGEDGITPEVLKRCNLDDIVLKFCNSALLEGLAPDQWKISNIIPVPKKGDLSKPDNYRGIALSSLVAKTLNRMILNRIQPIMEVLLRDNQNGFRAGRSTTSHILTLRRLLEGAKSRNLPAVLLFIDFKKAFDSIHRGTMLKILKAYGIPEILVNLIAILYTGTKAQVLTPDGITELFDILAGVLQGDTLAPYIFVIVVDYCMHIALDAHPELGFTLTPARSRRVKSVHCSDVEFADDIGLIADSIEDMQKILTNVETAANAVGLHMNVGKTKYLTINLEGQDPEILANSGDPIEKKENFLYLGSWIMNSENDIKVRKAKAWAACHKLKRIWTSNIKKSIKIRLFVATVESVLLYGSETWSLTKRLTKMIDGCYTRLLRMALNVSWKQHLTNKELYGKLPKISSKITERRMKLAGHIHRHPELTAHKLLFWEPLHGRPNRGCKPINFIDMLRKDTGVSSTQEIGSLMLDRKGWKIRTQESRDHYPT